MSVEISRYDPLSSSDTDHAEHYEVVTAVLAVDFPDQKHPTPEEFIRLARMPESKFGPISRWVARADGHIVGTGSAIYPQRENRHLTIVRVIVHPTRRRRGIGTALLRAMLPDLGVDGRTVVTSSGVKADASGDMWARELGFIRTHAYVRQFLKLPEVDPALWQRPVPDGFRLEHWTVAAPEALLEQYARARTAIRDAPHGDSLLDFPDWTPERVRAHEADFRARGSENHVFVAVHESSGRIAGITELELTSGERWRALQGDTAVLADFRGHGLGLALKGAMLRRLTAEHPEIVEVFTGTAHDNDHMIRVNHALGYTTQAVEATFEAKLTDLTASHA